MVRFFADHSLTVAALSASAVVAAALVAGSFVLLRRHRRKWLTNAAVIRRLIVYPVKSMQGIEVPRVDVTPQGFSFNGIEDRSLMLVNHENRMVSMRQEPRLALLKISLTPDASRVQVSAPGLQTLIIKPKNSVAADDEIVHFK